MGGPTNPLLKDGLTTVIGDGKAAGASGGFTSALQRAHARAGGADKGLLEGFRRIARLCDALALVRGVKDRACEIYKQARGGRVVGRDGCGGGQLPPTAVPLPPLVRALGIRE